MKKRLLSIALIIAVSALLSNQDSFDIDHVELQIELTSKEIKPIIKQPTELELIDALIQVESRGNDSAIGDRHLVGNEAVGALQIRPIMVREVNRILKIQKSDKRFKLSDRWDREKTVEMFLIWKGYHHKDGDFEKIARTWNGGPKGHKSSRTEKYWLKVQRELDI